MRDAPFRLQDTLGSNPILVAAGQYTAPKGQDYPAHFHNALEVIQYRSGHIECVIGGKSSGETMRDNDGQTFEVPLQGGIDPQVIRSDPGMVLVIPAGTIHADRALTAYSQFYLLIQTEPGVLQPSQPLTFMDDNNRSFEKIISSLEREWSGRAVRREGMVALLLGALEILCGRFEDESEPSELERLVQRAERLLEERFAESPNITQIALELGVSPSSLRSHFAKLREYSPKEFLQRVRLNRVLEMIRSSSLSLEEIALLTGYDSASHLSRHVKLATGLTPGQFRTTA